MKRENLKKLVSENVKKIMDNPDFNNMDLDSTRLAIRTNILLDSIPVLTGLDKMVDTEMVKYLTEHGAVSEHALIWASIRGHLDIVKYLSLHEADIHALDDLALAKASENGHLDVVKYLIERGANIHARDDYALKRGRKKVVNYLENYLKNLQ